MGAVKVHNIQEAEQAAKSQVCNHTLHAFGDNGRVVGTWVAASGPYGLRVSCKICGKFYGYAPLRTERTLQQLYKAYNEQRKSSANGVG